MASDASPSSNQTKEVKFVPTKQYSIDSSHTITLEQYPQQRMRWPKHGHHVIGTFSESAILVYQAFNHEIADYALREQKFDGAPGFSPTRMTWIKPNFLWMMYRSSWATAKNQERILGIWLKLDAFHELLMLSEQTSANRVYASKEAYNKARSAKKTVPGHEDEDWSGRVNIQWDPDHTPSGGKMARRAIQIGMKKLPWWSTGERFEGIVDMTEFVASQRRHAQEDSEDFVNLFTPQEFLYIVPDADIAAHAATDTTTADKEDEQRFLSTHMPSH